MTLRRRMTLAGSLAVAVAVVLSSTAAYVVTRAELLGQVDDQLRQQGQAIPRLVAAAPQALGSPATIALSRLGPDDGGPVAYVQVLRRDGSTLPKPNGPGFRLPIDAIDQAIAAGERGEAIRETRVGGVRFRTLTVPLGRRGAVQLARPLNSISQVLFRLRLFLALVCVLGVLLAAFLARVATRRITAPLREVADAAGHIGDTDDLGRRLTVRSQDELGQLAARFNAMLDRLASSREALAGSVTAQRQLIADASHELRTPITALRTNMEVLADGGALGPEAREALIGDLVEQTEELGALVADIIELARGDVPLVGEQEVRLDELVAAVIARASRHHPDLRVLLAREPTVIDGDAERLGRAVANLLDNAAKHAPRGSAVDVSVAPAGVVVRDRGSGVDADDLPHLFDRFYRGATHRALPGTGLGLAIVRQTATAHHGEVAVENAAGGGARFTLSLPARGVPDDGGRRAERPR